MTTDDQTDVPPAQRSTERLAVALESAGFDVGREFPALYDAIGREGQAVVRIGDVEPAVVDRLAAAIAAYAAQGDEEDSAGK